MRVPRGSVHCRRRRRSGSGNVLPGGTVDMQEQQLPLLPLQLPEEGPHAAGLVGKQVGREHSEVVEGVGGPGAGAAWAVGVGVAVVDAGAALDRVPVVAQREREAGETVPAANAPVRRGRLVRGRRQQLRLQAKCVFGEGRVTPPSAAPAQPRRQRQQPTHEPARVLAYGPRRGRHLGRRLRRTGCFRGKQLHVFPLVLPARAGGSPDRGLRARRLCGHLECQRCGGAFDGSDVALRRRHRR